MSVWYGLRDETESIATLHRALEAIIATPMSSTISKRLLDLAVSWPLAAA